MHSNHIHPIAEADISTVFKLCAKTFVYSGIDDVFSTVTPIEEITDLSLNILGKLMNSIPLLTN